jgi:UDP-N-acetyl-D-mannosaminuronic acid dehydrogenase
MPSYAVSRLSDALNGLAGARVLLLGVSYRGGVKETAFSGAFPVRDALESQGAIVFAQDPLFSDAELHALGFEPWDGAAIDAAVIQSDHAQYRSLSAADIPGARAIVDGRGIVDTETFRTAGVRVLGIGSG